MNLLMELIGVNCPKGLLGGELPPSHPALHQGVMADESINPVSQRNELQSPFSPKVTWNRGYEDITAPATNSLLAGL